MKKINFASGYRDVSHEEPRLWLLANGGLLVGGLVFVVVINLMHTPALYNAYVQQSQQRLLAARHGQADGAEYARLQKECDDYRVRVAKLTRRQHDPSSPLLYLRSLAAGSVQGVQLQRLRLDKQGIEISLGCRDPQQALGVARNLRELPGVEQLSLTSLEAHQGDAVASLYSCAMRGRLTGKSSAG